MQRFTLLSIYAFNLRCSVLVRNLHSSQKHSFVYCSPILVKIPNRILLCVVCNVKVYNLRIVLYSLLYFRRQFINRSRKTEVRYVKSANQWHTMEFDLYIKILTVSKFRYDWIWEQLQGYLVYIMWLIAEYIMLR